MTNRFAAALEYICDDWSPSWLAATIREALQLAQRADAPAVNPTGGGEAQRAIEALEELVAYREKALPQRWVLCGPYQKPDQLQSWEIRTEDHPHGKHDWPFRIAETTRGQASQIDENNFKFIASAANFDFLALLAVLRAALTAQPSPVTVEWKPTHRHVKRGTEYMVLNTAIMQCVDGAYDDMPLVLYRDKDGNHWVRPVAEFNDGRFELARQEAPTDKGEK